MADPLLGDGYPSLHHSANEASGQGQKRFLRAFLTRLGGLLVGTVGGALFVSLQLPTIGGWVALSGFLAALGAELYTRSQSPDKQWYEGRAAAESAKTLAWRYAVKGQSFEKSMTGAGLDREFLSRIDEVLNDLDGISLASPGGSTEQITAKMRSMRAEDFRARKTAYREGRLEDQRSWYEQKASENDAKLQRWTLVVLAAEFLGVVGGVLVVIGALTLDLLGVFAAVAATATAWLQAKQHSNLSTAYSITAQELASVKSELDSLSNEDDWAKFVGEAEEAISREHTLWRASRGLRVRVPRSGTT